MDNLTQRKLLSALCHGAIFFSSTIIAVGIPLVIFLQVKDPVVKENAKESLNFHINLYFYLLICLLLIFVLIGFPLVVLLGIASIIMPIIAIVRVFENPNKPYYYPGLFRVL